MNKNLFTVIIGVSAMALLEMPAATSKADPPLHKAVNGGASTDLSQTFDVAPGGKLTMNVDRGSIHIMGTDKNTVRIHLMRQVTGASDSDAAQILKDEQVVFTQDENEISITSQNPPELQHWSFFNHPNLDAQYEIALPRQFDIEAATSGGHIEVSDTRGSVRVETSGGHIAVSDVQGGVQAATSGGQITVSGVQGSVHAETSGGHIEASDIQGSADVKTSGGHIVCSKISGDISAHTSGGAVEATKCQGNLDLETSGGSITIDGFSGPGVYASTSGGSVSADFATAPRSDCELKTSAGSITVQLPGNAALQLDGQTSGGSVGSDFPVDINNRFGNGTISGAINGGGPVLRMETSAGRVEVRKK